MHESESLSDLKKAVHNLSEKDRKKLMDSDPEEIAERWEKMYEVPIKQSRFLMNDLFFKRSHKKD
ncbi:hypothetical protein EWH91_05810 [Sporolactobacillus sp. THM19-2]|nr:hypothetical protein EWH91_05810 [Sporolactobacillus sp. THM19-2]